MPNDFFRALSTTFFRHALVGELLPLGRFQAWLYILCLSQKQLHVIVRLLNCSAVRLNSCHDKDHKVDLKLINEWYTNGLNIYFHAHIQNILGELNVSSCVAESIVTNCRTFQPCRPLSTVYKTTDTAVWDTFYSKHWPMVLCDEEAASSEWYIRRWLIMLHCCVRIYDWPNYETNEQTEKGCTVYQIN